MHSGSSDNEIDTPQGLERVYVTLSAKSGDELGG